MWGLGRGPGSLGPGPRTLGPCQVRRPRVLCCPRPKFVFFCLERKGACKGTQGPKKQFREISFFLGGVREEEEEPREDVFEEALRGLWGALRSW